MNRTASPRGSYARRRYELDVEREAHIATLRELVEADVHIQNLKRRIADLETRLAERA